VLAAETCYEPLWEGYHESRRCSRDTYPESCITKYTCIVRYFTQIWAQVAPQRYEECAAFSRFSSLSLCHSLTRPLSHSLALSLSLSHTLSLSHSLTHARSLSHSLSLALSAGSAAEVPKMRGAFRGHKSTSTRRYFTRIMQVYEDISPGFY
jgi:hypothetical protein